MNLWGIFHTQTIAPCMKMFVFKYRECCVWWCTSAIPALGRPRQEDCEFKVSLGYYPHSNTNSNNNNKIFSNLRICVI
jgi:hypothetical protein